MWVLVRTASPVLTSTHNLCFKQKYEKMSEFLSENFQFSVVKFSIYNGSLFGEEGASCFAFLCFMAFAYTVCLGLFVVPLGIIIISKLFFWD